MAKPRRLYVKLYWNEEAIIASVVFFIIGIIIGWII